MVGEKKRFVRKKGGRKRMVVGGRKRMKQKTGGGKGIYGSRKNGWVVSLRQRKRT